jgi:hypothetical protein
MSTRHVRVTDGSRIVLAVSDVFHHQGLNQGRECPICRGQWTVQIDANQNFHVWRNGVPHDAAILDWTGNNVVVECCQKHG